MINKIIIPKRGIYYRDNNELQFKANRIIEYIRLNNYVDLDLELERFSDNIKSQIINDINNFFSMNYDNVILMSIVEIFIESIYCKYNIDNFHSNAKFIVFEGCDGVGKDYILDKIDLSDYPIVYTREPGGPEISELIRDIVLDKKYKNTMSYRTEFLLYCASRAQHVDEVIIPALQSGYHVISNRFYHSSLIYQKLRGLDDNYLKILTKFAINDNNPDVVFSLYNDAKVISDRIDSKDKDRLEMEGNTFFSKVNNMYKDIDSNVLINSISPSTKYITINSDSQDSIEYIKKCLIDIYK